MNKLFTIPKSLLLTTFSLFLVLLSLFSIETSAQTIKYVTPTGGSGITKDGSSWTNAAPGSQLQTIINGAQSGTQIWVAAGSYSPRVNPVTNAEDLSRDRTFLLKNGVSLYGGFKGTNNGGRPETIADRDIAANPTILSGNLGQQGINTDNAYHVVLAIGCNSSTILDGFIIEKGNANSIMISIVPTNNTIYNTKGAGMYNHSSSPTITNIIFRENTAMEDGGAMHNDISSPIIANSTFNENTATNGGAMHNDISSPIIANSTFNANTSDDGGAIYNNDQSSPSIVNSKFSGNMATGKGGVIRNFESSSSITNSSFTANSAGNEGGAIWSGTSSSVLITNSILYSNKVNGNVNNIFGPATVTYCLINNGGYAGTNNNINEDPLFVNPSAGDFRLKPNSPAINKGDKSTPLLAGINTDLNGKPRVTGTNIDMGVYESNYPSGANGIIYVKANGAGNFSGDSWDNAAAGLADALEAARSNETIKQIWVAKGTYKPAYNPIEYTMNDVTDPRDVTFLLKNGLSLYGGFKGDESNLESRNFTKYPTILSGDIGQLNTIGDNTYHVVLAFEAKNGAVLDGFTIEKGNANVNSYSKMGGENLNRGVGGGSYNYNSTPIIINNTFSANIANDGGAMCNEGSSPVIRNNSFINNITNGGGGGAIYNYASSPIIINNIFSTNKAQDGGAMFNYSVPLSHIISNTFYNNTSNSNTGAIRNEFNSNANITNSIFYNNTGSDITTVGNSVATVTYSLISHASYAGKDGNLAANADPLFVDANGGDFRLQPGSPAIDAGNNAGIPADIKTDISGKTRILGKAVDMGAYESIPYGVVNAYEQVTNILSPNGDGINDLWKIDNLDLYPDNEVKIFGSNGVLLRSYKNYQNDWDGTVNGRRLKEDAYYYVVYVASGKEVTKGSITIVY